MNINSIVRGIWNFYLHTWGSQTKSPRRFSLLHRKIASSTPKLIIVQWNSLHNTQESLQDSRKDWDFKIGRSRHSFTKEFQLLNPNSLKKIGFVHGHWILHMKVTRSIGLCHMHLHCPSGTRVLLKWDTNSKQANKTVMINDRSHSDQAWAFTNLKMNKFFWGAYFLVGNSCPTYKHM